MKRKLNDIKNIVKRGKTVFPNEYHSASSVKNFVLKDPVMDWLNMPTTPVTTTIYNMSVKSMATTTTTTTTTTPTCTKSFMDFITEQGKKFENSVMKILMSQMDHKDIVKIANSKEDILNHNKYLETVKAINDQIPVIYQGVLHGNEDFKAFGSPDLLIRSDFVDKFFDTKIDPVEKTGDKFNYVVIDIKFHTLKLRADGKFLLNEGRMVANKAQVIIYNELLGIAQGYKPKYCYILGRGWKYTKKNENFECLRFNERLGCIDPENKDIEYDQKIKDAFAWLDKLKKEGSDWTYNPPSVPELYPNMSNKFDNGNKQKKKIANEIEEITQLWYCGVKNRNLAHEQGIFKISDPRLTTDILGFPKGTNRTNIIDKMLKFNQGLINPHDKVIPKYVNGNLYDWKDHVEIEFYLDFETVTNVFDDFETLPNISGPGVDVDDMQIVFMIGLGISIKKPGEKTEWEYYNFRINKMTKDQEYVMFDKFFDKIKEVCKEHDVNANDVNMYHWGNIEQTVLQSIREKYSNPNKWGNLCLVDFCKIFQEESILIKGVYSFGLKNVGKGLINYGLIDIQDWEENVVDGLDAMVQAYSVYENPHQDNSQIINNLIKYNHTDVRIINKIINYLRNNHTINDTIEL